MCIKTILLLVVLLAAALAISSQGRKEAFGMSPGTLVQLESTHVSTPYEAAQEWNAEQEQIRKDLQDMTGSV